VANHRGVLFQLDPDGGPRQPVWRDRKLDCHHGGVVLVDGYIYGTGHKGKWLCLEWASGKVMWEDAGNGKGSLLYADGRLYAYGENGVVALAKVTPQGFQTISSFKVTPGTGEHWAHPALADGRLYLRHGDALMAYDVKTAVAAPAQN
jgi:outer membrane protein assembly factor BamB